MQQHRGSMSSTTYGSPENPQTMPTGNNVMPTSDSTGMPALSGGAEYPTSHSNNFSQPEMVIEHYGGNVEPPGHLLSIGEFEFDSMGFMDLSQYVPSTGMYWCLLYRARRCEKLFKFIIGTQSATSPLYGTYRVNWNFYCRVLT